MAVKPVFVHFNRNTQKYVVQSVRNWDWSYADTNWMNDADVGTNAIVPTIDIVDETFLFDTEEEAMSKIQELYLSPIQ